MILDHVNKMLIIGDLDKIDDTEPLRRLHDTISKLSFYNQIRAIIAS